MNAATKRNRATRNTTTKAVAYLRTSSATNVGPDKDSEHRQREAIARFAEREGFEVAEEFYDAAVSGKDAINDRPGFRALLERVSQQRRTRGHCREP